MSKFTVVVQARTSSTRLPGKVLKCVNGKPILQYVLERISIRNPKIPVIVCTSDLTDDDAVETLCNNLQIKCYRGNLLNVASRFYDISMNGEFEAFIRICADSPMIDGDLIRTMLEYWTPELDLLTNTVPRSFPKGQSIEIVNRKTFIHAFPRFQTEDDLEHVTHYFLRNLNDYIYKNFTNQKDYSEFSLAIDESHDLVNFERFVAQQGREWINSSFEDIIKSYSHHK